MIKIYPILSVLMALFILSSCDEVESPQVEQPELDFGLYPDPDVSTYPWPTWAVNSNTEINVLFEDYTGHKCVPCYEASLEAEEHESDANGRVMLTSVHASPDGGFQATSLDFPMDYTTEAGQAYVTEMSGFVGNPLGAMNRLTFGAQNEVWLPRFQWPEGLDEALGKDLKVNLQMQYNYYPSTNGLFIHVETEFLDAIEGQYNLVNYLIREEAISPQSTPFGTNEENHHHQVLSDVIGPIWGVNLSTGTTSAGAFIYSDFSYALPDPVADSTFEIENLTVFTFVHNRETYEVMQVIRTDLN